MQVMDANSRALGEEKVSKLLWKFSLPAIIGMMVNALYNVVDSIFVGNGVGVIGLTAVTIAFPLMILLMGSALMIGIGAATLISIRLGERRVAEAEKILGNAMSLAIIVSLITTVGGIAGLDWMLTLLGAEEQVLPYARDFTRVIILGCLVLNVSFGLNNIVRAVGHPRLAMVTMLVSAIINCILNPLFIFTLKLGIAGSALATVLAQIVAGIWLVIFFVGKKSPLRLRLVNLRIDRVISWQIVKIGFSPFSMQLGASLVTFLFNFSLMKYGGETAVAAVGVINRIIMLTLMPVFGISQGVQPIIGYNYGAKQFGRVTQALRQGIYAASAICIAGFILIYLFSTEVIRIFSDDPKLISVGVHGLGIMLVSLPTIGFQVIGTTYFQAVGKAGKSIFLSTSRQIIILIPMLFIMPLFWEADGVWASSPASDMVAAVLTAYFLWREMRKLKLRHQEQQTELDV